MDGMVSKKRTVNGVPTSLLDLGYADVGLDDAWQLCGEYGADKNTYHDENGRPVVDTSLFPDFNAMTNYAHSLGLTAGYSHNLLIKQFSKNAVVITISLFDAGGMATTASARTIATPMHATRKT